MRQHRQRHVEGTGNFAKDHRNFVAQTVGEQTTMNQMARDTGGQAFVNTNGLEEAIEKAFDAVPLLHDCLYANNHDWNGNYARLK